MEKHLAIYLVFSIYVSLIPLFAIIYYILYKKDKLNYSFASEILNTREHDENGNNISQVIDIESRIDFLTKCIDDINNNSIKDCVINNFGAEFILSDMRKIIFRRHISKAPRAISPIFVPPAIFLIEKNGEEAIGNAFRGVYSRSWMSSWDKYANETLLSLTKQLDELNSVVTQIANKNYLLWSYIDFLYFSTITQSTVGYGDILPNRTIVRFFVSCQIITAYILLIVVLNLFLSA